MDPISGSSQITDSTNLLIRLVENYRNVCEKRA